jgi:hypothetical protein
MRTTDALQSGLRLLDGVIYVPVGQGKHDGMKASGEKMAALRSCCCGEQNWIRAWRYCWTGREGEEKSAQDYRWKEMHRDICTCWTG